MYRRAPTTCGLATIHALFVCCVGDSVSSWYNAWDGQWRRVVDNNQHGQCRVFVLWGHGYPQPPRHTCTHCAHPTGNYYWRYLCL